MTNPAEGGKLVPGREPGNEVSISPEQLDDWLTLGDHWVQVIDVREEYERDAGHIPDTHHIALTELPDEADTIDKNRPVVFYCTTGNRLQFAAEAARVSGYEAHSLLGGFAVWSEEGRPTHQE